MYEHDIVIYDTESNGFYGEADRIWCMSMMPYPCEDFGSKAVEHYGPDQIEEGIERLRDTRVLVAHNEIEHDLPLMKDLYGFVLKPTQVVVDTLFFSRMLNPKRKPPEGMEKSAHSIEAWGKRFGLHKPGHEDWSQYSDDMRVRCNMDVMINYLVLEFLEDEAGQENLYYKTGHKPCLVC